MLTGTSCRFSVRFCAVTVTASRVTARSSGGVGVSCAKAVETIARQIAAASGTRARVAARARSGYCVCV